jgi:putative holliday junction resolvase
MYNGKMNYLGIDYGKKKVGLAVSEGIGARPLGILSVSSLEDAVTKVLVVIRREAIDLVIIGVAESGESRKMTERFIEALKRLNIDIVSVEETLSSFMADRAMREAGTKKSKRGENDAVAAAIILEDYLDKVKR